MSRLWDTPAFWARFEAEALLRDHPHTDVAALATAVERSPGGYDGDRDLKSDIIGELRRRADAGIRFWPAGAPPARPVTQAGLGQGSAGQARSHRAGLVGQAR